MEIQDQMLLTVWKISDFNIPFVNFLKDIIEKSLDMYKMSVYNNSWLALANPIRKAGENNDADSIC